MFIDHRYEVLEILGTGAWAQVYKVKDIRSDKLYTLKLFQFLSSEEFYANFSAELMHRITQIEHPNLINVVDFGHVSDHIYFISEYFEGSTLANFRFSKGKLDQIYDIVVQISYALHALHSQNILHRDLKLENVLYRTTGNSLELKVIDFGFSKVDQEKDKHSVSGSLPYIAPEVFLGKEPGPTSDFYSLGVLLYRLCTQNFPFDLEQITAVMNGSQQHFIPPFPTSLNEDIPNHLERLILYLLEKNPENRFQSAQEIISYVNRTSGRTYPFSLSWSLANTLRFNSYMVRKQYTQHILDYIPAIRDSNGKIITLIGGDGLGKGHILSLFRYHLLGGEFFHLDYTCTRTDHEAIFALIKEYLRTLPEDKVKDLKSLDNISDKFRSYLFSTLKESKELSQNAEELKQDFEAARMLITELSRQKPIIFIIHNCQYLHRNTIDFINYFSKYIINLPILMLLSGNDFNRLRKIENSVLIHVPLLTEDESKNYMNRLLGSQLPEDLADSLYRRSAGNPHFIREILVDLIKRKQIVHDDGLQFPENLDNYKLPALLRQAIDARMNRVSGRMNKHLQKLAIVCTPLTRNLIMQLLKLKDYELYGLLNEAIHNEIFIKRGKYYYYTFWEAHQKYLSKNTPEEVVQTSQEVLAYFEGRRVDDAQICLG
ncbi:MAG: protein kinase, partial [Candidatus Cloacimonadaceae bacterium]